jgi:CRISPR-associated protein Csx3
MKPVLQIYDLGDFRVVKFEIPGGITSPEEFATAVKEVEKSLAGDKVVLFNGRGPVWGYCMLVHAAHPTPAVGTYDPRLAGYVIVSTHHENYTLGQVIPDPEV